MRRKGARLGQHFLTGTWAARALVRATDAHAGDTILEIGPGRGALTRELLKTGARIVAIEKDERLAVSLQDTFSEEVKNELLRIVTGDVRDLKPETLDLKPGYIVAANIPYYITGEILRQFLTTRIQPRSMVLLVQKEVAERIIGRSPKKVGVTKESILSISVKAYGTPRIVVKVSRGNFSPPPSVNSAIILIENISRTFFDSVSEENFFKTVRAGFSSKRKLLAGNLRTAYSLSLPTIEATLAHCGVSMKARAEEVPLSKWKCLTKQILSARS